MEDRWENRTFSQYVSGLASILLASPVLASILPKKSSLMVIERFLDYMDRESCPFGNNVGNNLKKSN
jgi:hypothetical protein